MLEHWRAVRTTTSWNETVTRQVEGGPKITRSLVTYSLTGTIEGDSSLDYSMVYVSDSKAMVLGYEQVHVAIKGRLGTFVLRHEGAFDGGSATIELQIVPESGTGALVGISGKEQIKADSTNPMKATLDVDLP